MSAKPSVGRAVHYVLERPDRDPVHRPAVVTQVWTPEVVNLMVTLDGPNDIGTNEFGAAVNQVWRGTVMFDESGKPGTWHYPEAV